MKLGLWVYLFGATVLIAGVGGLCVKHCSLELFVVLGNCELSQTLKTTACLP